MKLFLCLFVLFKLSNCIFAAKPVEFVDGEYRGLVVAIHHSVQESENLIENLENLLLRTSKSLYDATAGRAMFSQIEVVVPQTWTDKNNYEKISGSQYERSHIRIGLPDIIRGDDPYTVQPRGCGQPGEFVRLSDNFVRQLDNQTKEDFGYPEKHLLHEWAHYRYGVFDEYGIPGDRKYPTFYIENGTVYPTTCVRGIRGRQSDPQGNPCKVYSGGIIDPQCVFVPDQKDNDARASIMFMPHLNTIDSFCQNNTKDLRFLHNTYAPSKQNILCNYKSTSQVINEHEDFANLDNTQTPKSYKNPEIKYFRVDEEQSSRFVLVLDVSGSMRDNQRISLLNTAATRFVRDLIPDGMELGVIEFATEANLLHEMVKINNGTRKSLVDVIPRNAEGWTAIGKAFKLALEILRKNNGKVRGSTLILVSDGEENQKEPTIEEIMPEILASGVRVDAVGVASADPRLENITSKSGGRCFYMNDNDSATNTIMETAFSGFVSQQSDIEVQPVTIKNREIVLIGNRNIIKKVIIDKELGKNTKFVVTSSEIHKLDVKFRSPDGQIFTDNNYWYRKDVNLKHVQLYLPESLSGHWEVIYSKDLRYTEDRSLAAALTVTSEPKQQEEQPIRLTTYFGKLEVRYPATAMIFAEVSKGSNPVIGAKVYATVERPDAEKVTVELLDDGSGFDVTANDGIYTTAFTQFSTNGRYSVSAQVTSTPTTKIRTKRSHFAYSFKIPKNNFNSLNKSQSEFKITDFVASSGQAEEKLETKPVSEFSRESEAGSFKLENFTPDIDLIPPGKVTNLRITGADEEKRIVELEWSAPGDDYYNGKVSKLDLRISSDQKDLINHFDQALQVTNNMLIHGNLEPVSGGAIQRIRLQVPNDLKKSEKPSDINKLGVYFALRGIDESNNTGEVSNLATVHFGFVDVNVIDKIVIGTNSRPFESITTQMDFDSLSDSVLFYHNRILLQNQQKVSAIRIPKELGRNTNFTIMSDDIEHLELSLIAPNGTVYDKQYKNFRVNSNEMVAEFLIDYAKAGTWKVKLARSRFNSKSLIIAYLSISSESRVDDPIKTRTWLDTPYRIKENGHSAVINSEITKRFSYVICAEVIAIVDRPKGEPIAVKLLDNGKGPDKVANDGLYSATFTQFNANGKYFVTARVINNGKMRLKLGIENGNQCGDGW